MSSLKTYREKRDFSSSSEPKGGGGRTSSAAARRFVVQRHHASRLHYDFRIELKGVLKSWAVPKGPSMNPSDKRLAMRVEDHPLDYGGFEGLIPKGNYGAGTVRIFDEGTYDFVDYDTEAEAVAALKKGSIKIHLHGEILEGEFALARMKGNQDNAWLLIKHDDEFATPGHFDAEDYVDDAIKNEGVAFKKQRKMTTKKNGSLNSVEGSWLPKPMYARLSDRIPDEGDWQFEKKYDGFRILVLKIDKEIKLLSRNRKIMNQKFPSLTAVWKDHPRDFCLDGELVIEDKAGKSHFQLLQKGEPSAPGMRLVYYPFDLIMLDKQKLDAFPLMDRQQLLELFLKKIDSPVIAEFGSLSGDPEHVMKEAQKQGWEGVIAKRKDSTYQQDKRNGDWLKVKLRRSQEAVICGFTEPSGSRTGFGALILGVYENKQLRYIGNCGSGFNDRVLADLHKKMKRLSRKTKPFGKDIAVANESKANWTTPKLVCEVYYSEWTLQQHLRHPVFKGLRDDKSAAEVRMEKEQMTETERELRFGSKKLKLTNLNKIYWPDSGITKGELLAYYEKVGDHMLPYLKDKPISMHRFPNGIDKPGFFQKDVEPDQLPSWTKTASILSESTGKNTDYIICNHLASLLFIANLGSIEINPWLASYRKMEYPEFAVLDLDPNGVDFGLLVEVARTAAALLDEIGITGFIKTSGSTGLHIYFYLARRYPFDLARNFIELLAQFIHERHPEDTSLIRDPKKRKGKIYLDFLQNRRGQTVAAPYSVRPKPMATVSAPLHWDELKTSFTIQDFTIRNMESRLSADDPWQEIWDHPINLKEVIHKF